MSTYNIVPGSRSFTDVSSKTPIDWESFDDCDEGAIQIGTGTYPVFGGNHKAWFETNSYISFGDSPVYEWQPDSFPGAGHNIVLLNFGDRSCCGPWDFWYDPTKWPSYLWSEDNGFIWAIRYEGYHYYDYDDFVFDADIKWEARLYPNGTIEITFEEAYPVGIFGWENIAGDDSNLDETIVEGVTYLFVPTGDSWTLLYNYHIEVVPDYYDLPEFSISGLCDFLEQGAFNLPQAQVSGTCSMVYYYSGVMKNLVGNNVPGRAVAFSMEDHSKQDEDTTTWEDGEFNLTTTVFSYFIMLPDDPQLRAKIVVPQV